MICEHCQKWHDEPLHHIIRRGRGGGLDNEYNMISLCGECHHSQHHGRDDKLREAVLSTCIEHIKPNLDKCWSGKIKPILVGKIESGIL